MGFRTKIRSCTIWLVLWAAVAAFAASEDVVEHDNSRIAIFLQPAISFLSFEEREYFQDAIDTIYSEFRSVARNEEESLYVAKQNFQKVNFCFPIMAGIQYQVFNDHFISAGIGYIYDKESVVLTDRKNNAHNYSYTIQGIPMFLEYRLAIPTSLITLSNGGLFSIALRWYWTLPGTEIYTTWGKIEAENKPWGAGFGVSLGYLIASWNGINLYGDIGFSSISVKSKESFADIVPDGPTEKAKWNIGGLQLQIRASFGIINKKVVIGDTTAVKDTTANVGTLAPAAKQPAVDSTETKPANKAEAKPAGAEPPAASTKPLVAGEEPPAAKPPESEINATKEKAAQ